MHIFIKLYLKQYDILSECVHTLIIYNCFMVVLWLFYGCFMVVLWLFYTCFMVVKCLSYIYTHLPHTNSVMPHNLAIAFLCKARPSQSPNEPSTQIPCPPLHLCDHMRDSSRHGETNSGMRRNGLAVRTRCIDCRRI